MSGTWIFWLASSKFSPKIKKMDMNWLFVIVILKDLSAIGIHSSVIIHKSVIISSLKSQVSTQPAYLLPT
jgi:hypothetical protein